MMYWRDMQAALTEQAGDNQVKKAQEGLVSKQYVFKVKISQYMLDFI